MPNAIQRKITMDETPASYGLIAGQTEYLHNTSKYTKDAFHEDTITPNKQREKLENTTDFSSILRNSGRWLMVCDVVTIVAAFLSGGLFSWLISVLFLHNHFQSLFSYETLRQFLTFTVLGACAMLWFDARGHYRQRLPFWEKVGHFIIVSLIGFITCGFTEFFVQKTSSRLWLAMGWFFFAFYLFAGRIYTRRKLDKMGKWKIPVVIVGTHSSAEALVSALSREPSMGFEIVEQIGANDIDSFAKPKSWRRLLEICEAAHIFLALEGGELERHKASIRALVRERLPFSIVPPWQELPTGTLSQHHFLMHDIMLLHDTNRLLLPLPCLLKRSFDIVCSATALLLVSPIVIPVAFMVKKDGGPVFFKQPRVGRNGAVFFCYKFRSMRMDAEEFLKNYLANNPKEAEEWKRFQKLKNDVRITKFGHFIRKTSIDELPQLLNVLKGDMSLVGPRPIMIEQEEFYGDDFIYYKSVRPGITGPWQVSGRNRLAFAARVRLECSYARNWSLWLDIVILLKTLPALLKKDSVF